MDILNKLFCLDGGSKDRIDLMQNAFVSVLENSTWYSCQEIYGLPGNEELTLIAGNMVQYVITRPDVLYANEETIFYSEKYSRANAFKLAKEYSSDFIFESAYSFIKEKNLSFLYSHRDRLSAACLFRYKFCVIHEELFLLSFISQWVKLSNLINKLSGSAECQVDALLDALKFLESWSDSQ
ncbi:hypothetical protein HC024_18250 [Methylococcaceae bacterium WWC4]|nr:hypothetical protein [Methylococcaceae bacterium WWC4]